jgi:hypothetical protein
MVAWIHQPVADKLQFIHLQLSYLESADSDIRQSGVICLSHLVQGRFYTSAYDRRVWRGGQF